MRSHSRNGCRTWRMSGQEAARGVARGGEQRVCDTQRMRLRAEVQTGCEREGALTGREVGALG